MGKWKERFGKLVNTCFEGEVIIPKTTLWMIGMICLLSGIVHGLLAAPWTHGVNIACNNGNNNGNSDNYYDDGNAEMEAAAE